MLPPGKDVDPTPPGRNFIPYAELIRNNQADGEQKGTLAPDLFLKKKEELINGYPPAGKLYPPAGYQPKLVESRLLNYSLTLTLKHNVLRGWQRPP